LGVGITCDACTIDEACGAGVRGTPLEGADGSIAPGALGTTIRRGGAIGIAVAIDVAMAVLDV